MCHMLGSLVALQSSSDYFQGYFTITRPPSKTALRCIVRVLVHTLRNDYFRSIWDLPFHAHTRLTGLCNDKHCVNFMAQTCTCMTCTDVLFRLGTQLVQFNLALNSS